MKTALSVALVVAGRRRAEELDARRAGDRICRQGRKSGLCDRRTPETRRQPRMSWSRRHAAIAASPLLAILFMKIGGPQGLGNRPQKTMARRFWRVCASWFGER